MFVALDTNSWFREKLLRSGLGATLLYAVRQSGATLVMPGVIRMETVARLTDEGVKSVKQIRQSLTTIAALVGNRPDPDLPSEEAIKEAIERRLTELGEFIEQVEPTMEDYTRATARVVAKRPPNHQEEQFRDSLILEQLIRRYPQGEGYLVTNDGDFFAAKGSAALAPALEAEQRANGWVFKIVRSIEDALKGLGQSALEPDRPAILGAISRDVLFRLREHSKTHGYDVANIKTSKVEAFLTENHDELFVSFEVDWLARGIPLSNGEVLPEGTVTTIGTALFDLRTASASKVQVSVVRVSSPSGEVIHQDATVFAEGAIIFLGAPRAQYRLRRPLGQ